MFTVFRWVGDGGIGDGWTVAGIVVGTVGAISVSRRRGAGDAGTAVSAGGAARRGFADCAAGAKAIPA